MGDTGTGYRPCSSTPASKLVVRPPSLWQHCEYRGRAFAEWQAVSAANGWISPTHINAR